MALLGRGKIDGFTTALGTVGLNSSTLLVGRSDGLGLGGKVTLGGTALDASLAAVKEGGVFGGHCFGSSLELGADFGGDIFKVAFLGQFGLYLGRRRPYIV